MPGPPPTPTNTLQLRGSWRAATRPNEPQPQPVTELPTPELPTKALEVWNVVAPRLLATRLLTVADLPALERYARLLAAWRDAMTAVETKQDRSTILTLAKLDELVRRLEANFGLTPSDRVGLSVEQPPNNDGKSRFFEQRRSA